MGINLSDLPLPVQERVAKQLLQENRAQTEKRKKYGNEKVENAGIKFDSKAEAERFSELLLMRKAGVISDLKVHPEFTLIEAYVLPSGEKVRRMKYTADFSYITTGDGKLVVEDVKSRPTKTKDYQMRKKLMLDRYGISIKEVERNG